MSFFHFPFKIIKASIYLLFVLCLLTLGAFPMQQSGLIPDTSFSAEASWTSGGPYGGYVNCLAMAASNPDILYAGTDHGVFKTSDSGANWMRKGLLDSNILSIEVDPSDPDIVYAGVFRSGIYKSSNGGITWTQKGFSDQNVNTIAIDDNNSNILYIGTGDWFRSYDEEIIGIFKSTDGGDTWNEKISWEDWGVCGWDQVYSIIIDPDDSSYIYAGGGDSGYCGNYGGFLKSTDGGETWNNQALSSLSADKVKALVITPAGYSPSTLYAAATGDSSVDWALDVYKSTDNGENWTELYMPYTGINAEALTIAVDPLYPNWIYVGTSINDYPLYLYKDDTDKWYDGGADFTSDPPTSIEVNPQNSDILYIGFAEGGVYKSTDWAVTWNLINNGINDTYITNLAVDSTTSNRVFASIKDSYNLAKTTSGGTSWEYLPNSGSNYGAVSLDPQNPSTLYMGHDWHRSYHFSIYRSTDNGQSWNGIEFIECTGDDCYTRIADILIDENNSDYLLVATTQEYSSYQGLHGVGVLMRTTDGGTNWTQLGYELSTTALAVDPNNQSTIYSGKHRVGQVFQFTDVWGNYTSREITPGSGIGNVQDIEVDKDSKVYVATDAGLMKWDDPSWTTLTGLPSNDISALAIDRSTSPEIIYAGLNGDGIYFSQDGGSTWTEFNTGLENLNITKLAVSKSEPKMLYAGTAYGGVWIRTLPAGQTYTLTISVNGQGTTDPASGTHVYANGTQVEITANPESGYNFSSWGGDIPSNHTSDNPITITMDSNKSVNAYFVSASAPIISPNRNYLYFGATTSGDKTDNQQFLISNSGGGSLDWSVTDDVSWLSCSPESGTGDTAITASVDPSGLSAGSYPAVITVSSATASNSPQTVSVILNVYAAGSDAAPFGSFDTPTDQSTVMSSVPVTGWVVDDIGIESLKIYRDPLSGEGASLIFIGDAVFVEGARPDVESLYPDYPLNYQAGWGYMLLTNFLPDQGNGTFVLYAVAKDTSGHEVTLGSKTITCDNANAVKPFGAIDTPTQGGTASGDAFVNFGWALTPMPNSIPTDGSTINVFVDGVNLGHPAYNNYRADIATLFPGYANSDGAVGFYTLDTTAYANGVHSIVWSVEDNVGNVDGIGSRYFSIFNGSTADAAKAQGISKRVSINTPMSFEEVISTVPSFDPIAVKKGYREDTAPVSLQPDSYGVSTIAIKEVERLVINLNPSTSYTGYLMVGNRLRALPLGSTLDPRTGIFSWQPGPGFLGEYELVFIRGNSSSNRVKINVRVKIKPKFGLK